MGSRISSAVQTRSQFATARVGVAWAQMIWHFWRSTPRQWHVNTYFRSVQINGPMLFFPRNMDGPIIFASFRICEAWDAEALTFWPLQFQILQQWPRQHGCLKWGSDSAHHQPINQASNRGVQLATCPNSEASIWVQRDCLASPKNRLKS